MIQPSDLQAELARRLRAYESSAIADAALPAAIAGQIARVQAAAAAAAA